MQRRTAAMDRVARRRRLVIPEIALKNVRTDRSGTFENRAVEGQYAQRESVNALEDRAHE